MEWVDTIVIVIGFILLGWYQHYRIRSLEGQIVSHRHLLASQKDVLESVQVCLDVFRPEQLRGWARSTEDAIEKERELEIEKIRSGMEGLMQDTSKGSRWTAREINATTDLIVRLLFHVPLDVRKKCIEKMPNSMSRDVCKKVVDHIPEYEQILGEVERKVKEVFPHKFENPNRQAPTSVDTGTPVLTTPKKQSYESLPDDAKAQCDSLVAQKILTKEQYVKDYYEEG